VLNIYYDRKATLGVSRFKTESVVLVDMRLYLGHGISVPLHYGYRPTVEVTKLREQK
jgi:hypothetical protein